MAAGSLLRGGGYRSAKLYVSSIAKCHKKRYPVAPRLQQARLGVQRACSRSIGPARQAEPFPVREVATLKKEYCTGDEFLCDLPHEAALVGTWYLNKEVSASTLANGCAPSGR